MSWLLVVGLKNAILVLPLAGLALCVGRYLRRPALAHLLWACVLLKLLTPPLIEVPVGWQLNVKAWLGSGAESRERRAESSEQNASSSRRDQGNAASPVRPLQTPSLARQASMAAPAASRLSRRPGAEVREVPSQEAAWSLTWTRSAVAVWLVGSLVVLAIMARRAWKFRRFVRLAVQRDEYLGVRVAELAHAAGVRVPPRVIVVDGIVSPMLWGLGQNARLIFPSQLAKRLSAAKLDALLLHELAHFERKDHWIRVLELAACVLYWWHPLVWWALREIEAAEEECCDAWVVARQSDTRHSYAEALLTAVDFLCERRTSLPPAACGLGEVTLLRARLTKIMRGQAAARLSRALQTLVLTGGLLLSPLEPALWATSSSTSLTPRTMSKKLAAGPRASTTRRTGSEGPARVEETIMPSDTGSPAPLSRESGAPLTHQTILPASPRPLASLWATAISANGKFRLEARTGRKTTLLHVGSKWRLDLSAYGFTCVSFSPDSRKFATGHEDALVRLWDSETGGLLRSFKGSNAAITSVQVSPDGRSVAAGSRDGSVLVWDLTTADATARLPRQDAPISCLRWSKRGNRLAIALGAWSEQDEAALLIWQPENSLIESRWPLEEPPGALDWLSPDKLIVAGWNGQCRIWSVGRSGTPSYKVEPTGQLTVEKDHVSAAAWSPDCLLISKWLADQLLTMDR